MLVCLQMKSAIVNTCPGTPCHKKAKLIPDYICMELGKAQARVNTCLHSICRGWEKMWEKPERLPYWNFPEPLNPLGKTSEKPERGETALPCCCPCLDQSLVLIDVLILLALSVSGEGLTFSSNLLVSWRPRSIQWCGTPAVIPLIWTLHSSLRLFQSSHSQLPNDLKP